MDNLDLLYKIHQDLPREGPGDSQSTRRAFEMLVDLPAWPVILDIGCGPGKQTLDLAACSRGFIVALDNHKPYLDQLKAEAEKRGYGERIVCVQADMSHLPFRRKAFDVIWAEGSIFIMGFRRGLEAWRGYLKRGGWLAVTELTWFKHDPPEEVVRFWELCDVKIRYVNVLREAAEKLRYHLTSYFKLPEAAWWEEYYRPLEERLKLVRESYLDNEEVLAMIDLEQQEIDLYRKYSEYYGHVFYIMKRG